MALNPIARRALSLAFQNVLRQQCAAGSTYVKTPKIGAREVVGFGYNGEQNYVDRIDFPMSAIRYKEDTPDILALREKEKGDWSKLTLEEKKALYRASFCQTFAEIHAPTGEWKSIIGAVLIGCSCAIWVYLWMKVYVYFPMPDTVTEEKKLKQLQRMIDLRVNPVTGISSKYDYEKGDWK